MRLPKLLCGSCTQFQNNQLHVIYFTAYTKGGPQVSEKPSKVIIYPIVMFLIAINKSGLSYVRDVFRLKITV